MSKRLQRRLQVARLKKKRKHYWRYGTEQDLTHEPRLLGMVVSTPQRCSCCLCCGNARDAYGDTMQERKVKDSEKIIDD